MRIARMTRLLRLLKDRRGIAAVEFALLVPAMMLLLYGTVELGNALLLSRKITAATQAVGDLTAQELEMNTTKMNDVFAAVGEILRPFPTTGAGYVVTSIIRDPDTDQHRVVWSRAFGTGVAKAANSTQTVPANMLPVAGDTVILAQIKYTFVPLLGDLIFTSGFATGDQAYLRPRRVKSIPFS
jgi:Flp pilus assembly protein TadG